LHGKLGKVGCEDVMSEWNIELSNVKADFDDLFGQPEDMGVPDAAIQNLQHLHKKIGSCMRASTGNRHIGIG